MWKVEDCSRLAKKDKNHCPNELTITRSRQTTDTVSKILMLGDAKRKRDGFFEAGMCDFS